MSTKLILGLAAATAVAVSAACNDDSCRNRAVNMLNMDAQLDTKVVDAIQNLDFVVADDLADYLETEAFEVGAGKIKFKKILKKVGRAAEKAAKNYARNLLDNFEMQEEEVEDVEAFEMGKLRIKRIIKKVGRTAERVAKNYAKNYARNLIGAYEVEDVEAESFEMGVSKIKIGRILEEIAKETARELLNGYEMQEEDAEDVEAFEMGRKIKIGRILEKIAKETARELLNGYEMQEEEAEDVEAFEMGRKIKIGKVIKEIARQTALELLNFELSEELGEEADVEAFEMGSRWTKLRDKVRRAAERAAKNWARERLGAFELEEEAAEFDAAHIDNVKAIFKKQIKPYRPRPYIPGRHTMPVRRPFIPGRQTFPVKQPVDILTRLRKLKTKRVQE